MLDRLSGLLKKVALLPREDAGRLSLSVKPGTYRFKAQLIERGRSLPHHRGELDVIVEVLATTSGELMAEAHLRDAQGPTDNRAYRSLLADQGRVDHPVPLRRVKLVDIWNAAWIDKDGEQEVLYGHVSIRDDKREGFGTKTVRDIQVLIGLEPNGVTLNQWEKGPAKGYGLDSTATIALTDKLSIDIFGGGQLVLTDEARRF
jgi:hypothetical protein